MSDLMQSWCVLRMSGPATLAVAKALQEADFEAWTPQHLSEVRVGLQRKIVMKPAPVLASYVFARYDRLAELVAFSRSPAQTFQVFDKDLRRMVTKGCPHFSVMRHNGRYIAVSDRSLNSLRKADRRGKPIEEVRLFSPGEHVKFSEGAFEGLAGIVQMATKKYALVCLPGWAIPVEVPHTDILAAA